MPIEPISFAVGTALGATGLLLAFSGAVSGYNTLTNIFAEDTGLQYAALQYYIECLKLQLWGEQCQIKDKTNCKLLVLPTEVQETVHRILVELRHKQQVVAKSFLDKYDLRQTADDRAEDPATEEDSDEETDWLGKIEVVKAKKPRNFWRRLRWTLSKSPEFTVLLSQMAKLNQDLWDVTSLRRDDVDRVNESILGAIDSFSERIILQDRLSADQIATAVSTRLEAFLTRNAPGSTEDIVSQIVAGVSEQLVLEPNLEEGYYDTKPSTLVRHLARVKDIQAMDLHDAARLVKYIGAGRREDEMFTVTSCERNVTNGRYFGKYQEKGKVTIPVFVEWKGVDVNNQAKSDIILRIRTLAALLSCTSAPDFSRHHFLGLFDDRVYEETTRGGRRFGFVYRLSPLCMEVPVSLLGLIEKAARDHTRPPLGARFVLAQRLASAVSLLHASRWIHKSLRSDNILFGPDIDITLPYIAGFQYSRPASDQSREARPLGDPKLDLYYHPDVTRGWTKILEIYSLGIVLLEVAWWRPLYLSRFADMDLQQVSSFIRNDLKGRSGEALRGMVGSIYVDAVQSCFEGHAAFGVVSGDSEPEATMLNDAFFRKVIEPLMSCRA